MVSGAAVLKQSLLQLGQQSLSINDVYSAADANTDFFNAGSQG